jgi:hypothetical protein
MAEYRAYTVGRDGHFTGFEPLICADDSEAIERATRLVDGHDIELWSGTRLVIRLKHKPPDPRGESCAKNASNSALQSNATEGL